MRMPTTTAAVAIAILAGTGCGHHPPPPGPPIGKAEAPDAFSHNISSNSIFGSSRVTAQIDLCAGRVQLGQGVATLKDSCFTGDTNVVLCTDSTAANPVRCAAGPGQLEITGTGADMINYARIR
jgi:hypothetical protein